MSKINPKDTKAILIGVSEFQDKENFVNALPIKNNVPKIKSLLQDPVILGLPDENILVFTKNERHDEILNGIENFLSKDFTDTVIFYFAGHGYKTTNGNFYMVTNNSKAKRIAYTALPWIEIKNILETDGIQQRFYIIDACHSGAATLSADKNVLEIEKGSALIAAATEDAKAYFNKNEKYTDFSKAFIQTIEDGANNIELEAFNVNYIHDNINKILLKNDNKFDTQIKKTDKIDNVFFFKNKKYDIKEIERKQKQKEINKKTDSINEQIKKADNLFENLNFKDAEIIYTRTKRKIQSENIDIENSIKTGLDNKIIDCEKISEYETLFDNRYKKIHKIENEKIKNKIVELQKEKKELESKFDKTQNEIEQKTRIINNLNKNIKEKESKINQLENSINKYKITNQKPITQYKKQEEQTSKLQIGQKHAGGIIFHIDKTGKHGLVCAEKDQGEYKWGCEVTEIVGTKEEIGTGKQNTEIIIKKCDKKNIAAKICADLKLNSYADWFLPSIDELNLS